MEISSYNLTVSFTSRSLAMALLNNFRSGSEHSLANGLQLLHDIPATGLGSRSIKKTFLSPTFPQVCAIQTNQQPGSKSVLWLGKVHISIALAKS